MSDKLLKKESKVLKIFVASLNDSISNTYDRISSSSYREFLSDKYTLARAAKVGVTVRIFEEIQQFSPLNERQWSDSLNINVRTFQRYKTQPAHVFKPIQSAKILELAEVFNEGSKVFDNDDDFKDWLNTPSLALDNKKPIDLLDSSYGKDLVLAELNNIEYGIFI